MDSGEGVAMGADEVRLVPEVDVSPDWKEFDAGSPVNTREKFGFDGSSNPSTRVDRLDMMTQGRLDRLATAAEPQPCA